MNMKKYPLRWPFKVVLFVDAVCTQWHFRFISNVLAQKQEARSSGGARMEI
jgi:hypothetical protein